MFRSNWKCSGVNHQARNGFSTGPEFLGGCRKCSGIVQNFSGENMRAKNIVSPDEGEDPPDSWGVCYGGAPFRGQPTFGGFLLGGPLSWEASSPIWWSMFWGRWGPPWGGPMCWHGQGVGPPLWGFLPPLVGGFV